MKFSEFLNQKQQLNERVTQDFRNEFGRNDSSRMFRNIRKSAGNLENAPFNPNDAQTRLTRLPIEIIDLLKVNTQKFKYFNQIENFKGFVIKTEKYSFWFEVDDNGIITDHEAGIRDILFLDDGATTFRQLFNRLDDVIMVYAVTTDIESKRDLDRLMTRLNQPVIDADDLEDTRVEAREVDRNARIGEKRFSRESKRLTESRSRRSKYKHINEQSPWNVKREKIMETLAKKIDGRFELSYRKYNDYADDIFEYSFTTDPDDIIVSITFELNQTCVYDVHINVADYSGEYEDERDAILKDLIKKTKRVLNSYNHQFSAYSVSTNSDDVDAQYWLSYDREKGECVYFE